MRIGRNKESLYNTIIRVNNKEEWNIATNYYISHGFEFYANPGWLEPYNYDGYVLIEKGYDNKYFKIVEANLKWNEISKFKDITNSVIK